MKNKWQRIVSGLLTLPLSLSAQAQGDSPDSQADPNNLEAFAELESEKISPQAMTRAAAGYSLSIDVINQVVSAYSSAGQVIRQMICSTGKNETPTPLGTFNTGSQYRWGYFTKFDCWAQYWTRIDGPYLFHSVLYGKKDESTLNQTSVKNLGSRASHGCVRLRVADAEWIFNNCPRNTKTVIFEGIQDARYTAAVKAKGMLQGADLYLSGATKPAGQAASVKTNTGTLNLRAAPNTSSKIITQLPKNASVIILSTTNSGWARVFYQGIVGYASADYLSIKGDQPVDLVLCVGTVTTKSSPLNLRAGASTSSAVISSIPNATEVDILEELDGWLRVCFQGLYGYLSSDYVKYDKQSYDTGTVSTAGGALNLRELPSTTSRILLGIPNATKLQILSYDEGWAFVIYQGLKGYVSMQYLRVTGKN